MCDGYRKRNKIFVFLVLVNCFFRVVLFFLDLVFFFDIYILILVFCLEIFVKCFSIIRKEKRMRRKKRVRYFVEVYLVSGICGISGCLLVVFIFFVEFGLIL